MKKSVILLLCVFVLGLSFGVCSYTYSVSAECNHSFGSPSYSWKNGYCTASKTCILCQTTVTETQKGNYVKDTEPTCEEFEKGHLEVNFVDSDFTKQTTEKNSSQIPDTQIFHIFDTPTYTWKGKECTATKTCTRPACGKVVTETQKGEYVKDTEPTCTDNELGHLVATFSDFPSQSTTSNSYEKVDSKLGHSYGTRSYTWHDDECTASVSCTRKGCTQSLSETKTATYVKDLDATCTANEYGHYEVTFNNKTLRKTATSECSVEKPDTKLNHDYVITYTWSDDLTSCTAEYDCKRAGCISYAMETVTEFTDKDGYRYAYFTDEVFKTQSVKLPEPVLPPEQDKKGCKSALPLTPLLPCIIVVLIKKRKDV